MSDETKQTLDNSIYVDFCKGMRNQSRDQVRFAGSIAHRLTKIYSAKDTEILSSVAANFCQLETNLENIENNLNKVAALTRQYR